MTVSEAFAALDVKGTLGGYTTMMSSSDSVVSDKYPGMAIDLFFCMGSTKTVRKLDSWNLRRRRACEFYLPYRLVEEKGNGP